MAEFKGRSIYVVVERQEGLIERVLVARTYRKAFGAFRKLLKENHVKIDGEILRYESYADWAGFEVKLTDATLLD
jgi:hypothetical protein